MKEKGKVVRTDGAYAVVRIDKKSECDKCGLCLFPKGASCTEISAENPLNAAEGDDVIIETSKNAPLIGVALAFLVPLMLIGIAVGVGLFLKNSEIWIPVIGVILVVLWYTILAAIDKKLRKKRGFCPVVAEIIKEETQEENE